MEGGNELSNLMPVTPEQHFDIHYTDWCNQGANQDLVACYKIEEGHLDKIVLTDKERKMVEDILNIKKKEEKILSSITQTGEWKGMEIGQGYVDATIRSKRNRGYDQIIVNMVDYSTSKTMRTVTIDTKTKKFKVVRGG